MTGLNVMTLLALVIVLIVQGCDGPQPTLPNREDPHDRFYASPQITIEFEEVVRTHKVVVGEGVAPTDVEEVFALFESGVLGYGLDVLEIKAKANGNLSIVTGSRDDPPLKGAGEIFLLEKVPEGWRLVDSASWMS